MSYWWVGILLVLAAIAVAVAYYVFAINLRNIEPPLPETAKFRFLRALTCSYAICVKDNCNDPNIISIGFLDKQHTESCWSVCDDFKKQGHLCGPDYKIRFEFDDDVTYNANYEKSEYHNPIAGTSYWMETDVMTYMKWFQNGIQSHTICFGGIGRVTLNGREYQAGCTYTGGQQNPWIDGLCEGTIRSIDGNTVSDGDPGTNTGYLWITPNIEKQCEPFETAGYFKKCNFNKGQIIYIQTEKDVWQSTFAGDTYCPELIISS